MKSKIVMLYPPTGYFTDYNTPMGVLYVSTVLKNNGYGVKFIDCSVEKDYHEMVLKESQDALCIGSYCMSIHVKHLIPLLEDVKKSNPDIKIVLGGVHPTLFPEQTASDDLIDFIVIGEGEETMLELVQAIESERHDFENIKGIGFKKNGHAIITERREFIDMDTLPFVDWGLMNSTALSTMSERIARVQTSRGCYFKCAFCLNVVSKNRKMRYRSAKNVVDEIEHMVKIYNVRRIGIRDEVFLTNRKQVREMAEELISRNIKITWLANPHILLTRDSWLDNDLLELMVRSGCNKLQAGGESGSQRILDMLHKTITPDDILTFVKRARNHNIIPLVAFMTSFPTETREEQLETLKLIWQILEENQQTFINGMAMFRPYPGGELYDRCVTEYGLNMPDTLRGWMEIDIVGGKKQPWVDRLWFDQNLWTHTMFARLSKVGQLTEICEKISQKYGLHYAIAAYLYGKLSHLRLKYNYYSFPFEFYALHLLWKWRGEIPELS